MFYTRDIFPQLQHEITTPEIVVLTGMRQVGKTTLLQHLFEQIESSNKAFFDAENPLHRKLFEEENYDNIWRNLSEFGITTKTRAWLFIDEIQHMPELTRAVKYLYDHYQVKFFLTGSSSFYLKNLFPESLSGRKRIFELFPLSFGEYLVFKNRSRSVPSSWQARANHKNRVAWELYKEDFTEYVRYGGFPKVVLEPAVDRKQRHLEEIFTSYFEHDVKSLADLRETARLRDLILLMAARIGSKLDITKLASELSLSRETIYSYLGLLEKTYFIHLLPRASASADRRAAGSRKVYVCDSGLAQALGPLSAGQALENAVLQSLRPHHQLSYWQSRHGGEIDFIVDGTVGFEVKVTGTPSDVAQLAKRAGAAKIPEWYIVSQQYSDHSQVILAQDI